MAKGWPSNIFTSQKLILYTKSLDTSGLSLFLTPTSANVKWRCYFHALWITSLVFQLFYSRNIKLKIGKNNFNSATCKYNISMYFICVGTNFTVFRFCIFFIFFKVSLIHKKKRGTPTFWKKKSYKEEKKKKERKRNLSQLISPCAQSTEKHPPPHPSVQTLTSNRWTAPSCSFLASTWAWGTQGGVHLY